MSRRAGRPAVRGGAVGWLAAALAVGLAAAVWRQGAAPGGGGPIGGVTACQVLPQFAAALGVGPRAMFGTSLQGVKGLAVLDPDAAGAGRSPVYQHPSWDDAGYLGPFVYDRRGDIYAAPVPLVSLADNPPAEQNRIVVIDSADQALTTFVELPSAQPPSGANPFGVIGLAYDCDGDRLYASSVAGSDAATERGRLWRIELPSGTATPVLDGLDPFGVALFRGRDGLRLYYGLARQPELYSLALDAAGAAVGAPRRELSLAELPAPTTDKIRRIRFGDGPTMALHAYDFGYSLQVASERVERVLLFDYDAAADRWTFRGDASEAAGP